MSELLKVINNTSSDVKLMCIQAHIVKLEEFEKSYRKGEIHPRNVIYLIPGKWKIAAKKHQSC